MYINFWYPVGRSEEITADEPFRVQILGLHFVAFRDEDGQAHVLSDTCTHRGGALGKGWVKDNCVVCPYHGWRFSGDGKCIAIPSLGPGAKSPPRAKVDSYPVQEQYGIVFAFLGDLPEEERTPLYQIEEVGQEGWRANNLVVFEVDYYYERSMENGLDPAHNEFVHPTHGYNGQNPEYRVFDFETVQKEQGIFFWSTFESSAYEDEVMQKVRKTAGKTRAGSGTYGPNVLITHIHLTDTNWFHQYFYEAPIDENRTRIFFINMRNCMLDPEYDKPMEERNMVIAKQDIDLLTHLDPVRTPISNTKEVLMPADKPIVEFRKWLDKWEAQGWKIDQKTLRDNRGDIAYAIPSPDRRTTGNWVLDTIPCVDPAHVQAKAAE